MIALPSDTDPGSGQFRLRLPPSMHQALVAEAEREQLSLSTLCIVKLAASLNSVVKRTK